MSDRARAIVVALIVQLIVTAALVPWSAASDPELYAGAKLALAIGLLANVLTQLVMMRRATRSPPSGKDAPTSEDVSGREPERRR
jgi:hypothetical protein